MATATTSLHILITYDDPGTVLRTLHAIIEDSWGKSPMKLETPSTAMQWYFSLFMGSDRINRMLQLFFSMDC